MWWYDEKPITISRKKPRRKRRKAATPLLQVSARRKTRKQKDGGAHMVGIVLVGVAILALCAGIVMGTIYLGRKLFKENPDFIITELDLKSDGRLSPDHIREYAALKTGENLFAVDIKDIRKRLESVSLVEHVSVRRQLPNKLVVRVVERTALARLRSHRNAFSLAVDREGYVLGPTSSSPLLPVVTSFTEKGLRPGNRIRSKKIRDALNVLDICDATPLVNKYVKIKEINVRDPERLDIKLSTGERVLLSRNKLEWRLRRVSACLQAAKQKGRSYTLINAMGDNNVTAQ